MVSAPHGTPRHISRLPVVLFIVAAVVAVSLVLLGAALAGRPAPTPSTAVVPGAADQPRDVVVTLHDYSFEPTPLYLFPGETVRLHVFNWGMVDHELVLGDAAVQNAWDGADAQATPPADFATAPPASVQPSVGGLRLVLASGGSTAALYQVPALGGLELMCHLPGHIAEGMIGQVVLVR